MKLLYSLYFNHTGYSIASQENILALHSVHPEVDIKCRFFHNAPIGVSRDRQLFFEQRKTTGPNEEFDIAVSQSVPQIYTRNPRSKRNVGFCVFETITIPKTWLSKMNSMDMILTASQFNKGIFEANGISKPIRVIPHCFDSKMFNRSIRPFGRYSMKTFLSIGQWKERKNWESLIRAFFEAFDQKDNVCLLIKTDRPEIFQGTVERIKKNEQWRSKETCPIFSEPKSICQFEELPYLMKKADFYVSASLGEGFGLPGLHAMALGIPVITTRFGGTLEYARPDNCTYIEPRRYETRPTMDHLPQFKNAVWPVIPIEEIAAKLRYAFENDLSTKTETAYRNAHDEFSYEAIGKKYYEALAL